jgi:hypothetical protein
MSNVSLLKLQVVYGYNIPPVDEEGGRLVSICILKKCCRSSMWNSNNGIVGPPYAITKTFKSISTNGQYVTLQIYFSYPSFSQKLFFSFQLSL